MNATTPPRRCASARMCWQSVVLPDDSGPKISVIRPRGTPPTPSARSSAIEPVGMTSIAWIEADPSFMIEPRPNCFSIARMAASTAFPRSAVARYAARSAIAAARSPAAALSPLRRSDARSLVIAMVGVAPLPQFTADRGGTRPGGSDSLGFRGVLVPARLPRGLDDLHVGRRLEERLQAGLGVLGLCLLLDFLVRSVARAHLLCLRWRSRYGPALHADCSATSFRLMRLAPARSPASCAVNVPARSAVRILVMKSSVKVRL